MGADRVDSSVVTGARGSSTTVKVTFSFSPGRGFARDDGDLTRGDHHGLAGDERERHGFRRDGNIDGDGRVRGSDVAVRGSDVAVLAVLGCAIRRGSDVADGNHANARRVRVGGVPARADVSSDVSSEVSASKSPPIATRPSFGGNHPEVHGTSSLAAHAAGASVPNLVGARLSQQLWYA